MCRCVGYATIPYTCIMKTYTFQLETNVVGIPELVGESTWIPVFCFKEMIRKNYWMVVRVGFCYDTVFEVMVNYKSRIVVRND